MDQLEKATLQLHNALKECFEQIRFARAADLARSRRYLEAEGLLVPNGRISSDPEELDLLARIAAQQRQYERAARLWRAALQQAPGNLDYERAIERAKDAGRSRALSRRAAVIALGVLAAGTLVIGVWSFRPRYSRTPAKHGESQPNVDAKTKRPFPSGPVPATTPAKPSAPEPAPEMPQNE